MKIDEMTPSKSKFLTKEDVGEAGKNLTIGRFEQQEVGNESEKEMKYVIVWQQADYKPMVLNKQNGNRLKVIAKTDDSTKMIGLTVNVFNDVFVEFGGKVTGGVRIRPAARQAQKPMAKSAPAEHTADPNDELPPLESYEEDSGIPF